MSVSARRALGALVVLFQAPLVAQQVHVVAPGGAGGAFATLGAAVDAAASGDTILVEPGDYTEIFGSTTIEGKSLVIIGDGLPKPVVDPVFVRELSAGQSVLLRGLVIGPTDILSFASAGVTAEDNAGLLRIEDCTLRGSDGIEFAGLFTLDGAAGLSAIDSAGVTVVRSLLLGGDGTTTSTIPPTDWDNPSAGGPGLDAVRADVAVHAGSLRGGDGGSDPVFGTDGESGGAGLRAVDATVVLAGTDLVGGPGGDGCTAAIPGACQGGHALELLGGSHVYELEVGFLPGAGGDLLGGGPALPGGDAVQQPGDARVPWAGAARSLELSSPVRESTLATLRYEGQQGDLLALFLAVSPDHVLMPGRQGVLTLGAPLLGPLLVWTISAPDGVLEAPFVAPDVSSLGFDAATVYAQCFFAEPGGPALLSGPGALTVLASGF